MRQVLSSRTKLFSRDNLNSMGLSIYYKGRLRSKELLPALVDELQSIAEGHRWVYDIFETDLHHADFNSESFDDDIYGIAVGPPNCEPLFFTFLSNGTICSPIGLEHYLETNNKVLLNQIFVKTQFAGPEIHRQVIHLLDYINSKYLSNFEITDETGYCTHRNEKLLIARFG